MFSTVWSSMLTYFSQRLLVFTYVYSSLPMISTLHVICLPMFTHVDISLVFLPMFTPIYSFLPMFTFFLHKLTRVYPCLALFTLACLYMFNPV